MALFKIFNNIDSKTLNQETNKYEYNTLPSTYTKGYMYFDAQKSLFYIDTAGEGGTTGTRVALNAYGAEKAYQSLRSEAIPFGIVDSTSTKTAFTATVPGITELKDGTCVLLKNSVVTSDTNFTININNLGAKPSYTNLAAATRDTTIFNINYTMLFIYDSTRVAGGAWICYRGYDSNTNTIGYQIRTNSYSLPMDSVVYSYRLLFTSADGNKFVPANNSTSTNATSSRTPCQTKINPFGSIVYYGSTSSVAANSRPSVSALWQQYTITLGYSFNNTNAALALTSWKPVYVKCAPQTDGSAIIDSSTPFVQDLPTTNDGKIYIFLGVAYSATAIELLINHPVYYHDGDGIKQWTGVKVPTKVSDLTNDSGYITSYVNTTYTFANGTDGSFTVTPSGGTAQTVTVGKANTSDIADRVGHTLTIGTYSFDGSEDVTIPVYDGTYTWG